MLSCKFMSCNRTENLVKGYCNSHYRQLLRTGKVKEFSSKTKKYSTVNKTLAESVKRGIKGLSSKTSGSTQTKKRIVENTDNTIKRMQELAGIRKNNN